MFKTKSKRLSTVMLLVVAFLCSVFAFTSLGFTRTASAEDGALPTPIAKYLFDDKDNIGKDSVGDYDMSIIGGKDGFTQVDNGVEFDGNFALAMTGNNLFQGLTEFTMSFEMKSPCNKAWRNIIGVANNSGNYFYFDGTGGGQVRFHAKGQNEGYWSGAAIDEPAAGYTRITVSAKAGGYLKLYINGVEYQNTNASAEEKGKLNKQFAEDWTLYNAGDGGYVFSIGAPVKKNGDIDVDNQKQPLLDSGAIKELVFWNTQFTDEQVTQYWNEYANSHAKVASVDVDFTKNVVVSSGASNEFIMSNIVKNGEFDAVMSNGETKTVSVAWTGVVEKEGKRYIEGTVSGANNPNGVKAYASITEKTGKLASATLDLSSQIVIPASTAKEEILSLVPANGTYTATLEDGSEVLATIAWNDVTNDKNGDGSDTNTYIVGTVSEVTNTDNVKAYAKIYATDISLNPLAKYEFNDSANPGKDSMGQYDLIANGGITVTDGVATFDGVDDYLSVAHNFTSDLKSFSLSFEISKPDTTNAWWAAPVFFGMDGKKWLAFNFSGDNQLLRFSMSDRANGSTGNITNNGNECWGQEIGNLSTDKFHKVTLTVQAGGKCMVYLDGVVKFTGDVPADFDFTSNKLRFELGRAYNGNGQDIFFKGMLKNVTLYDFALTESQVKVFEKYDQVLALAGDNYIESYDVSTLTFDGGAQSSVEFTDQMTVKEMFDNLNSAKVETTLADGSKGEVGVYWDKVVKQGKKYIAQGYIRTVGLGVPYVLESRTVSYELAVKNLVYVEADEIENGEITLDKEEGYAGDVVTITVTPAQGYELVSVTANGTAIEAVDGKYTYIIGENDSSVTISATFKKVIALTINDVTGGTISTDKSGNLNVGDVVTITVALTNGYELATVTVNGTAITAVDGKYTYTVQEGDDAVVVSATYTRFYTITVTEVENATVELSATKAYAGDEITIKVTVADKYQLASVKVNGQEIKAENGVYKFTVNADSTVTVEVKAEEKTGCFGTIDASSMGMLFIVFAACGMVLFARKRRAN